MRSPSQCLDTGFHPKYYHNSTKSNHLSKIASPDTFEKSASDLAVVGRGEDLGVAGLTHVGPTLGLSGANTVESRKGGNFAKPATDEDVLKVVSRARRKNLAVCAGVELVRHDTRGRLDTVQGVILELRVLGELGQTELRAPGVDNGHVAGSGGNGRSRGNGRNRGDGSNGRVGNLDDGRCGVLDRGGRGGLVGASAVTASGSGSGLRLLVDDSGVDGGHLVSSGGDGGWGVDTFNLGDVDGLELGLDDNVDNVNGSSEDTGCKGSDRKSESRTHFDRFLVEFGTGRWRERVRR